MKNKGNPFIINTNININIIINIINSIFIMPPPIIIVNNSNDDDSNSLTTAISGQTPTDPFGDNPTLRSLLSTAASNADYALVVATIPRANKLTIKRIEYVLYEPYNIRRSKKVAWYWIDHGVELLRTTAGISPLPSPFSTVLYIVFI